MKRSKYFSDGILISGYKMIDRVKNTIGIILISITIVNAYIFTYPKNYEKYEKIYNILIQSDDQIMSNFERFVIDDINNYSNDDVVDVSN